MNTFKFFLSVVIVFALGILFYLNQAPKQISTHTVPSPTTSPFLSSKIPDIVYYSNIPNWQEGDHTTTFYRYNPSKNIQKIIFTIPTTKSSNLSSVTLSPDQTKIAYSLHVRTNSDKNGSDNSRQLWTVNTDGSNNRLISKDKGEGDYVYNDVIWSPDSQMILFNANKGNYEIVDVSQNIGNKTRLSLTGLSVEGWFTNNTVGFKEAKPTGCAEEQECYPSYKILTANLDGTKKTVHFDSTGDSDPSENNIWLHAGSGVLKIDFKGLTHIDFVNKRADLLIRSDDTSKRVSSVKEFPFMRSALASVDFLRPEVYKIDLESNATVKLADLPFAGEVVSISFDEKYFLMEFTPNGPSSRTNLTLGIYSIDGQFEGFVPHVYSNVLGFVN